MNSNSKGILLKLIDYNGIEMNMNNKFGGGGFHGGFTDNRPIGWADQMPDENEITTPCPLCKRNFIKYHFQNMQKTFKKYLKKKKSI